MDYQHVPVMLNEILEYLSPKAGQNFIDCTLGGAGYAIAIAKIIGPDGKVVAIDLDPEAIRNAEEKIRQTGLNNIILVQDNFKNLKNIVDRYKLRGGLNGVVLDLGVSSRQLDNPERGFSFRYDAPLDMTFSFEKNDRNAEDIVNETREKDLEIILKNYGEERYAGKIARGIIGARLKKRIRTTGELLEIIKKSVPSGYANSRNIHFATRTFQALRIAVNHELENLEQVLPQALEILESGGKIAAVSFHSLEDRIVKQFFKKEERDCLCPPAAPVCQCGHMARLKIITKKTVSPGRTEIRNNPRSRSAKLRLAQKI